MLLEVRLFGFVVRESYFFSWSCLPRSCEYCIAGLCGPMIRHGKTSTGRQRWRCKPCQITALNDIGVIGHYVLLEGGGLPCSPSAPRALLGASARSSASFVL